MPSSNSSLILPLVLWDHVAPECHISSMAIDENEKLIFTGTTSGHIIMWEFDIDEITPICLMIGHTGVVNCLANAGCSKDEEYLVSSSDNGEMKLWEINERKCIENIKMANTVHRNIYSSKTNGKYTRLYCVGNYTGVLVMDPMSLDILYNLVSKEQHQWIRALCINSFANQQDEVVVGVSISGTIKLWTVNANEPKGAEIVEHEYKNCQCESACVLVSCPGKHRIFMAVCPKFFQIFDAVDFTVLCLVKIESLITTANESQLTFTNGFFIDIDHIMVCTSDGNSYLYLLPDNSILNYLIASNTKQLNTPASTAAAAATANASTASNGANPQSVAFRQKVGRANVEKLVTTKLLRKLTRNETVLAKNGAKCNNNGLSNFYGPPVFHVYELKKKQTQHHQPNSKFLLRGDCQGRLTIWNLDLTAPAGSGSGSELVVHEQKNGYEMSLATFWKQNVRPEVESIGVISTFLYLPTIDKLVYGLLDGTIIIMPAIDFLVKHLFRRSSKANSNPGGKQPQPGFMKLKKHNSKVTCILYPHAEHARYDPNYLVSGSLDFSVILWNINTGDVVHKFVVQTGEILQLSVPPINVNPRILQCVCSVASDHSVALLSLKECKPVMVASRHLFPILFVKWRPLDDYLIVRCTDGSVFVWQIETGSLDRVAHGLVAEDIINAADEAVAGGSNMIIGDASMGPATPSSSSMSLLQASTLSSATAAAVGVAVASSNLSANNSSSAPIHKSQSVNNLAAANLTTPIISTNKSIANQTLALGQLLQKRNFSNSVKTMAQKMATSRDEQKKNPSSFDAYSSTINFPLIMQTFHLNPKDPVNHLLLFDIDSLLTSLILEEHSIDSVVKIIKTNLFKDTHNVQTAQTQIMTPLYRTTPDHSQTSLKRVASAKLFDAIDLKQLNMLKNKVGYAQSIIKITHILLSCLHLWSIDNELDQLFMDKLSLQKPKYPITFGQISRGAHLFVMFPPKRTYFTYNKAGAEPASSMVKSGSLVLQNRLIHQKSINLIDFDESDEQRELENQRTFRGVPLSKSKMSELSRIDSVDENKSQLGGVGGATDSPLSPANECYLSVKSLSTEHLLAILAIANSFMNLHNFIDLQIKHQDHDPIEFILSDASSHSLPTETNNYGQSQAQITQAYSRLSTMYCMLADYYDNEMSVSFKSLNLETLALKWMDQSYEIREAAQALLKNELKRIGPNGRTQLVRAWDHFLTSLLKDFDDQVAQQQHQQLNPAALAAQQQQAETQHQQQHKDLGGLDSANTQSNLNRIRRKQYVSIVLLSLIGAEFGQDVNTNAKNRESSQKPIPQGFSIEDHSILKRISTALTNFVTNKQLQADINRRASIDLMGRGFTIWEPFIQPTYVLLSLLELSADCEFYVPSLTINLPLIPVADLCRTARSALNLIANSKPKTFILTIAKEIKRVNASSGQSGQGQQGSFPFSQALTRGKPEILAIIERLIESQSQDVFELLSDVIEIILFCLDPNQIRSSPLEELFPPLFKFPMVRYCKETKRIVCGCHNGRLVLYEYKTSKWNFQSYPAHNNQPIVAAAISIDSKYVASYSAHDNSLIFWQSSGGNIFNIGSNTLKQIKSCNAAPIEINVPSSRLASLSFQSRTLNLSYHDGRKFTYTI